jgi:hypothetical protein
MVSVYMSRVYGAEQLFKVPERINVSSVLLFALYRLKESYGKGDLEQRGLFYLMFISDSDRDYLCFDLFKGRQVTH